MRHRHSDRLPVVGPSRRRRTVHENLRTSARPTFGQHGATGDFCRGELGERACVARTTGDSRMSVDSKASGGCGGQSDGTTIVGDQERRAAWLDRLCDEFLKLEKLMPVSFLPEGDYPDWVLKVEREFAATMFPVTNLKKGIVKTPRFMGALLGHQCANGVWMMDWMQEQCAEGEKIAQPESVSEADVQKAQ